MPMTSYFGTVWTFFKVGWVKEGEDYPKVDDPVEIIWELRIKCETQ